MDIIKQKEFGDKTIDLIKSEVGKSFGAKYQGDPNGKVAILVITGSDPKFIGKIKTYIWNGFHASLSKINGHGSGIDTTIVINLAEQSEETFSKINLCHKNVYPNGTKKSNRHLLKGILKVELNVNEAEVLLQSSELSADDLSTIKKCRSTLSSFLNSTYSFEKKFNSAIGNYKTFFSYEDSSDLEMQVVYCKDESIAKQIEMAIKSFIGNPDSTSLDKNEVLVNFTKMMERGKRSTNGSYSLPPNENSTTEEVHYRLCRVSYWAKPKKIEDNGGNFIVTYPRLITAQKIYKEISQMGWRVKMDEDGLIHVIVRTCNSPKETILLALKKAEEKMTEIVSKPANLSVKDLFSLPEAIKQLKRMFENESIWPKISPERKIKITSILKEDQRNGNKENFVKILLDPSLYPLFTKEEAILELRAIFKSSYFPDFKNSVKEQIRSKLREGLIDLDPDQLASDLLDLF